MRLGSSHTTANGWLSALILEGGLHLTVAVHRKRQLIAEDVSDSVGRDYLTNSISGKACLEVRIRISVKS